MTTVTSKDLKKAYKKEKDLQVRARILAVNMICMNNASIKYTADTLLQCPNWVTIWVQRFKEGGIDALVDLPRSGRPPKIDLEKIAKIVSDADGIITPKKLKCIIQKKFRVNYHITNIRRILHKLDMSAKTVKRIHINRAEIKQIKRWQHNAKRRISRLESNEFAVVVFDEAIFIDDPASGVKYQSKKGEPIVRPYKGRHGKVVVVVVAYGSIATDDRQFFRTYDRFDKETVLQYIKELVRHFKKVAIIMDNAPQHKACILQEFLDGNPNVKVIWMPTATPEVSVTEEEYWHQAKRDVLVSEYMPQLGRCAMYHHNISGRRVRILT